MFRVPENQLIAALQSRQSGYYYDQPYFRPWGNGGQVEQAPRRRKRRRSWQSSSARTRKLAVPPLRACEEGRGAPPLGGEGPEFTESPGPGRKDGHLLLGSGRAGTVMFNLRRCLGKCGFRKQGEQHSQSGEQHSQSGEQQEPRRGKLAP